MVIVIDSVIGGFSWEDLVRLAASTVRLQVFDYSRPIAANYPITTFEEYVMVPSS